MKGFLAWFNTKPSADSVIKAAIAHLWFVTIDPFEDGNGRIAPAIADMALARSESSAQRFYSMSAQIRKERKAYYDIMEKTQRGDLDITPWLSWFLECLGRAFDAADIILENVLKKARFWEKFATVKLNDRQRLVINRLLDGFEANFNRPNGRRSRRVRAIQRCVISMIWSNRTSSSKTRAGDAAQVIPSPVSEIGPFIKRRIADHRE